MTEEPTRRIHEDPEFARLFEASEKDGPSRLEMDKALSRATQMATSSRSSAGRWRSSGLLVGGVFVGALVVGAFVRTEGAPSPRGVDVVASSSAPAAASSSTPVTPVPTVSVDDLAAAPIAPSAPKLPMSPQASAALARPPKVGTSFDDELALVSAARSALERKDVRECLLAVEQHERRFHSGLFSQEIEVIHIEALFLSGERARARAWAERFLVANATSPYTRRVRSVLDRADD